MSRILTALLCALVLCARPAAAQGIGIFLQHDRLAEYGAGAGLNVLSRGPWIAKSWRHPVLRFVGVQVTSLAYERLFDYNGWNWSDYRERLYGYLLTEGAIEGVRALLRRHRR